MARSEVGEKAQQLYESKIRPLVESTNLGRYIVIDVNSGDYDIGDDYLAPTDNLLGRHPDAALYTLRIGYPTVGRIGGRARPVGV